MPRDRIGYIALSFISLGYLLVAGLFAILTPDWQTPDEPAHYNYVRQIARRAEFPVIEMGDWDQTYLDELKSARFAPELLDFLDTIQYEDHQPPLYYVLASPIFIMTNGDLTALRLYTLLFGLFVIWSAYFICLLMFPYQSWLGLSAALFVAFQPQHVHILASVNNDALAWALIALTLLATVTYLRSKRAVRPWQLGLLVGAGLITKSTTYFLLAVVPLAITLHWWRAHRKALRESAEVTFPEETRRDAISPPVGRLLRQITLFLLPALALGGAWWLRNIDVYGYPDFLGLAAHDAVVVGQPRTEALIETLGIGGYLRELLTVTYHSFWGQFGWMGVPMEARFYWVLGLFLLLALGGLGADMFVLRPRHNKYTRADQRNVWIVLGATALLSVAAFLYYNTEFQQHQGRYLFPLLIPLAIWLALGMDAWRRVAMNFVARVIPVQREWILLYTPYLTMVAFLPFPLLDVWLLWRVIVPNLRVM